MRLLVPGLVQLRTSKPEQEEQEQAADPEKGILHKLFAGSEKTDSQKKKCHRQKEIQEAQGREEPESRNNSQQQKERQPDDRRIHQPHTPQLTRQLN